VTDCDECLEGYLLVNNVCTDQCPDKTYPSRKIQINYLKNNLIRFGYVLAYVDFPQVLMGKDVLSAM